MDVSPRRPRVLVVHPGLSTFVARDINHLGTVFEVDQWEWPGPKRPWHLLGLVRKVRRADVVLCWFAGLHAAIALAMAKVARRPVAIIVGGYEVASVPEFGYGAYTTRHGRWASNKCLREASRLLFVDHGLLSEAQLRVPDMAPARVLPTGYTVPPSLPDGPRKGVLTVAAAHDMQRVQIKGLDLFLEAAARVPETPFRIIGASDEAMTWLRAHAPPNVTVDGAMAPDDLPKAMAEASVFLLASVREGLPNVVCEAMAQGCIPIGSDVPGIRSAVGDAGILVERNAAALAEAVRLALRGSPLQREAARSHIVNHFSDDQRRHGLTAELMALT